MTVKVACLVTAEAAEEAGRTTDSEEYFEPLILIVLAHIPSVLLYLGIFCVHVVFSDDKDAKLDEEGVVA